MTIHSIVFKYEEYVYTNIIHLLYTAEHVFYRWHRTPHPYSTHCNGLNFNEFGGYLYKFIAQVDYDKVYRARRNALTDTWTISLPIMVCRNSSIIVSENNKHK